jgi:putative protease
MPTSDDITNIHNSAASERRLELGKIINYFSRSKVAVLNLTSGDLNMGDTILITGNKTGLVKVKVDSMEIDYKKIQHAKKGQLVAVLIQELVRENDLVYKIIKTRN